MSPEFRNLLCKTLRSAEVGQIEGHLIEKDPLSGQCSVCAIGLLYVELLADGNYSATYDHTQTDLAYLDAADALGLTREEAEELVSWNDAFHLNFSEIATQIEKKW